MCIRYRAENARALLLDLTESLAKARTQANQRQHGQNECAKQEARSATMLRDITGLNAVSVSYTHLDVYKRQRKTFDEEYGLSAESLRKGGKTLLGKDGKLADLLAAGSANLAALSSLRDSLDEQAKALFTPGRRVASQPFYSTTARLHDARTALKNTGTSIDAWKLSLIHILQGGKLGFALVNILRQCAIFAVQIAQTLCGLFPSRDLGCGNLGKRWQSI